MMHPQLEMKVSLSRFQTQSHVEIRPARNDDWPSIERILSRADRYYMGLEWWAIHEWLGQPTFLLALDEQGRVLGLVLSIMGEGPIAWLRAMSVASDRYIRPLLVASIDSIRERGGTGLAFLGDDGWVTSELRGADFQKINQVVTLRWLGSHRVDNGPPDLIVRAADVSDIDAILTVDQAAFVPLWWYDRDVLRRALNLAYCFDVAYRGDDCVGYQLSTLRNKRGHIVRLATHPRWQKKGIAGRLLCTAIRALEDAGATSVTVNTQQDNQVSLHLYQRHAFQRIGQPSSVWFRSLEQE
jgi:ribosomal-protein-alanine N-acetyltransferase